MHCRPAGQLDRKHFITGVHTDTVYPVQTPNLYLIFMFLNKKNFVVLCFLLYLTVK